MSKLKTLIFQFFTEKLLKLKLNYLHFKRLKFEFPAFSLKLKKNDNKIK